LFLAVRNSHFSCIVYPKMWGSEVLKFGSVFHTRFLCAFRNSSINKNKVESLLKKLTVPQLVTKFRAFYATRKFITTSTFPLLSQTNPLHASIPIFLNKVQNYPTNLPRDLLSNFSPTEFSIKTCMHISSRPYVLHAMPMSFFLI
jgi:hypothetical protein